MTRKQWLSLAAVVVLGGLALYLRYDDWFGKDIIQMYHRAQPARAWGRKRPQTLAYTPVFFGFDRKLRLTDIRVVPVAAVTTNKHSLPIWHMTSDSNSIPTKGFLYGEKVPGMRPAVKGALPDALEPGTKYRLFLEAGNIKLQHDFDALPPMR